MNTTINQLTKIKSILWNKSEAFEVKIKTGQYESHLVCKNEAHADLVIDVLMNAGFERCIDETRNYKKI